jgi:hypothetical protein
VASSDDLWGATLTDVRLDLLSGRVELDTTVPQESGAALLHRVVLRGVRHFALTNVVPVPWRYAELTAWSEERRDDRLLVAIELWSEPTGLSIDCEGYSIEDR